MSSTSAPGWMTRVTFGLLAASLAAVTVPCLAGSTVWASRLGQVAVCACLVWLIVVLCALAATVTEPADNER